MLVGSPPSVRPDTILKMTNSHSIPFYDDDEILPESVKHLIYQMLNENIEQRVIIDDIREHPWTLGCKTMKQQYIIQQQRSSSSSVIEKNMHIKQNMNRIRIEIKNNQKSNREYLNLNRNVSVSNAMESKKSNNNERNGKSREKYSLRMKIMHALRNTNLHPIPSQKEISESFAFFFAIQKYFKKHDTIIDCCGSHGLISYLFAIYCRTSHLYVIDKNQPKSFQTIGEVLEIPTNVVQYISEDIYQALPKLLKTVDHSKIGVISCHACAHLSDSILDMCIESKMTEFAIMPCCHARSDLHFQVGSIVDTLNVDLHFQRTGNIRKIGQSDKIINEGIVKDIITFGRGIQAGYDMKWKMIGAKITPHNRILIGLKYQMEKQKEKQEIIEDRKRRMNYVYSNQSSNINS